MSMAQATICNDTEDPLRQIRVLFARMPKMLIDILDHVIASESDMMIAGRVKDDEDFLTATRRVRADVILMGQTGGDEHENVAALLSARPKLKVVTIRGDGATGFLYELRPQRIPLGELSMDALRSAIRGHPPLPSGNAMT